MQRRFITEFYLTLPPPAIVTKDLAAGGWLGICMPEEVSLVQLVYAPTTDQILKYGGSAMGIAEAAVMMQTISESGGGLAAASSVRVRARRRNQSLIPPVYIDPFT